MNVAIAEVDGFLGYVDCFDIIGATMEGGEREASGISKAVEDSPTFGIESYELPVFALVDEEACFLTFIEVDDHRVAVFIDFVFG